MQAESQQNPIDVTPRSSSQPLSRPLGASMDPGAIALLLAAALFGLLRFWKLGEWSFWGDEIFTYADGRFGLGSDQMWNPLGYGMLMGVADLMGERPDEFAMRLLPALVGWLCIPLSWWAFRCWVGDRRAALVALLLAVCSWHLYWSQSARFYTLVMATSLLGSGLLSRGLLGGRRVLAAVGLLVTASATAFHATASLMVPALCVAAWCGRFRRESLADGTVAPGPSRAVGNLLALILVVSGALATPWLWDVLVHHTDQKGTSEWLQGPVHLGLTLGYFYTPLFGAAALVGGFWAIRQRDPAGQFALVVALVVLGSSLLVSTQVLMTAQYTFALLPWVLLLAVLPLEALGRCTTGRALFRAGALVLFAPTLMSGLLYFISRGGERPRWREAYTYVDNHREEGDLILGMCTEVGEYYLGVDKPQPRRPRTVSPLGDWHPDGPRRWNRHNRRIWVVVRPQWFEGLRPEDAHMWRAWLSNDCRLVKSFPQLMEGRDLALQVYLRDPGLR